MLDDGAVAWLSIIDTAALSDHQRLGLAFLHRNTTITNQQDRSPPGCDSVAGVAAVSRPPDESPVAPMARVCVVSVSTTPADNRWRRRTRRFRHRGRSP